VIPEDKIAEIRQAARISEFISPHVQIRRHGRSMTALCPFHAEKTPSFSINDDKGFFHCFGCGESGNVFTFLMRVEGLSFPEALHKVADRCGIEVREEDGGRRSERDAMFAANASAAKYFGRFLHERPEAEPVRSYVASRGISPAAAERFLLGAAPSSGDGLSRWFEREGVSRAIAARLGLIVERDGRMKDRFRSRLMFPIRDTQGRVIGFGGRGVRSDSRPKYLNSPESEVYRKSRVLYGMYEARAALQEASQESSRLVVVEGYLDVISLSQAGIGGVVATCGTAMTSDQTRMMKRFVGEVVTLFDGDRAGKEAAARSVAAFLEAGLWPRGACPPEGEDPDSYIGKAGCEAMQALIDGATPLVDDYIRYIVSREPDTSAGKARAAAELAGVLAKVEDVFERDLLIKKAALWTGISARLLAQARPPAPSGRSAATRSAEAVRRPPARPRRGGAPGPEELLVTLLLATDGFAETVSRAGVVERMEDGPWADVARRVVGDHSRGKAGDVAEYLLMLGEHDRARVSKRLTDDTFSDGSLCERMIKDCIQGIDGAARKRQNRELLNRIRKQEQLGVDVDPVESLRGFKPSRGSDG